MTGHGQQRRRSFLGRLLRIFLYLFLVSILYLIVCKWIFPPVTVTQLSALFTGRGLKRDYVSWDEISPNVKLAAMASEDQLFPDHGGFDWKAIDKSLNGDQRRRKR